MKWNEISVDAMYPIKNVYHRHSRITRQKNINCFDLCYCTVLTKNDVVKLFVGWNEGWRWRSWRWWWSHDRRWRIESQRYIMLSFAKCNWSKLFVFFESFLGSRLKAKKRRPKAPALPPQSASIDVSSTSTLTSTSISTLTPSATTPPTDPVDSSNNFGLCIIKLF